MVDEETLMVEDAATASPDAEAVKQYLEQEAQKTTVEVPVVEKEESAPKIREVDITDSKFSTIISADTTFDKDEAEEITRMYMAPVKDSEVPITDDDQAMYLKALLNDATLMMTQSMANDQIKVTCRALSVYEQDLVLEAALKASGGPENGLAALLPSLAQQFRATMQIVDINGVSQRPVYMTPKRGKAHDAQVDELIEVSDDRTGKMPASKFGFMIRALNVFEHKVAKMHELAYNKTFWKPVEID